MLLADELHVLVDVTGLDGEPVRRRVGGLVVLDRDRQRAGAVGVAALADEDGGRELASWLSNAGVKIALGGKPPLRGPCFVTPLGEDASSASVRLDLDPARTIGVDMFGAFPGRRTLMKTPLTSAETLGAAFAALSGEKTPVTVINDSPGFVVQRMLSMIVNIGTRIAELRIAAPADIDTAVELGLNYPKGPLAFGDALGGTRVLSVLDGMHAITHDPKYRATTWLRRRASLGYLCLRRIEIVLIHADPQFRYSAAAPIDIDLRAIHENRNRILRPMRLRAARPCGAGHDPGTAAVGTDQSAPLERRRVRNQGRRPGCLLEEGERTISDR